VKVSIQSDNDSIFICGIFQYVAIHSTAQPDFAGVDDIPAPIPQNCGRTSWNALIQQNTDQAATSGII
jgi:hypothetical protein